MLSSNNLSPIQSLKWLFACLFGLFIYWEMLTGAPGALVKDTKKRNYIVIIALKIV